jgi:4-amino-4-deoxy-L-arabinose transferase-like glycosyltransferase
MPRGSKKGSDPKAHKSGSKTRAKSQDKGNRVLNWLRRHKLDAAIMTVLVVISGTVSAVNMTGYPQRFEDEGTYISQAWAIKERAQLTHYTYWYDHPPVGWIQMAGHLVTTDAIDRYGSAITAGREFMLILHLATIVLLYALARRFGIGSIAAGVGTLAYALSPLSVEFSRYVLLDNVALPWLLAAFLLAVSPRQHLVTAIGSAVCMAVAILSKETLAILLPVLLYALWTSGDKRNRRYTLIVFAVVLVMVGSFYAMYAALKNELIPGQGHVSLMGTIACNLFVREG